MPTLRNASAPNLEIQITEEGYLMNISMWTREVAQIMAKEELNCDLTQDHWQIVDCIREYYQEFGVAPAQQIVCKLTELSIAQIDDLFPMGYAEGACKIAGIPKPDPHLFGRLSNYAGVSVIS